jgi:hypothetical protein
VLLGRSDRQHDPVVSLQVGRDLHPVRLVDPHRSVLASAFGALRSLLLPVAASDTAGAASNRPER